MVYSQRLCKMKYGSMKQTTTLLEFDEPKRFYFGNKFLRGAPPSFGFDELEKRHGRRAGREIWEGACRFPNVW